MKVKVVLAMVVVIIALFLVMRGGGQRDDAATELLKRQSRAEAVAVPTDAQRAAEADAIFEGLVAEGKGMPLPETLIAKPDGKGGWMVGMEGGEHVAQLPFAPGHLRTPPPAQTAIHENPGYLGADACRECHQERHASFVHTAHHKTSAAAGAETLQGDFQDGGNALATMTDQVSFEMLLRDGAYLQRAKFFDWRFEIPIDMVFGSAKLGQTHLFWHEDALYQACVSYLTAADSWGNSPGYVEGDAMYGRPITHRCVECHSTYVDVRPGENHFTPGTMVFGISCERCHGPGQRHVEHHRRNTDDRTARHISVPTDFTRAQQLDLCGQCHFGVPRLKGDPFQFRPGDQLTEFYEPDTSQSQGGVHTTNQLTRLSLSRCFSETEMTCTDCHDPHQNERGNSALFSRRCLECHQSEHCGMQAQLGASISDNCIDCHMPKQESEEMFLRTSSGREFPKLRDHHIRVDQEATRSFLETQQ